MGNLGLVDGIQMTKQKTIAERRMEAVEKCSDACHREYGKYLDATQAARDEYFATLKQIDADADQGLMALTETKEPL